MMMERQRNQENTSTHLLSNTSMKQESPRKTSVGGDHRLKRDEWSEGAVASLLEAYESKWILRNRAKLKGHDWEDVARYVSSRANSTKSPKTQTQCKNKIESMKKRYRSESATAAACGGDNTASSSSWPLYSRLDNLLRGGNGAAGTGNHTSPISPSPIQQHQPPPPPPPCGGTTASASASDNNNNNNHHHQEALILLEQPPALQPPEPLPPVETAQNSHESDALAGVPKEDGGNGTAKELSDQMSESEENLMETSTSTPALIYSDKERLNMKKPMEKRTRKNTKKQKREQSADNNNIADSIRWLAEAMVRSEQVRMDGMRELEAMRVEAEVKRGEMDLKRTEIIANTQLDIAKIFAAVAGKGVDSSLRIGRN